MFALRLHGVASHQQHVHSGGGSAVRGVTTRLFMPTVRPSTIFSAGKKDKGGGGQNTAQKIPEMEKRLKADFKKTDADKQLPAQFLLKYAQFNMGPYMIGKKVGLEIQEAMYQLHIKDKDFWTVPRIAVKFGLRDNLTAAVLISKYEEKEALKKGAVLDDELDRAIGDQFGWIDTEQYKPGFISPLTPIHSDLTNLGDEIDFALLAKAHEKRQVVPPPHQLPAKAPDFIIPTRRISPPTRANKFHRSLLAVMNVDLSRKRNKRKKVPIEEQFIMMRDFDGSFRTPTWDERRYISRKFSNQPRLDWGRMNPYPLDLDKATNPRVPLLRKWMTKEAPKHTPRGPNAVGESPKHKVTHHPLPLHRH